MISWNNLAGWWLVWPVIGGFLIAVSMLRLRFKLSKLLSGPSFINLNNYQRKLKFKVCLWVIIFSTILIAFLAPQWGQDEVVLLEQGRNIVIALDVSKSMLAQDLKPSRLDFAKNKIKKLLTLLPGDQVGLVLFASDAMVICPLTRDQNLLINFLDEIDWQVVSAGATDLAKAINLGTNILSQIDSGNASNLLVIFTDGEDFSPNLEQAAKQAQKSGIAVCTVGVATLQGAPIPDFDLQGQQIGFIKNQQNETVISRLNQNLLKNVAQQCHGQMVAISMLDDQDLQQINWWVEQFERSQLKNKELSVAPQKYYYFLIVTIICLIVEWLI